MMNAMMNDTQCKTMNDKDCITDLLTSQKHMTCTYNTYCNEAATPAVRACLLSILRDEHTIAEELFNTMNTKGWYPTETAETQKLMKVKNQFSKS